jgi:hypothetical protein
VHKGSFQPKADGNQQPERFSFLNILKRFLGNLEREIWKALDWFDFYGFFKKAFGVGL